MNYKFSKTDLYLILIYYILVIPINSLDYEDYDNKTDLIFENLIMITSDMLCLVGIVYFIFPYFFPKKKYFLLILSSIGYLFFLGLIFINIFCYVGNCTGNPVSFAGAYRGLTFIVESFATLGLMVIGKKLFETQLKFANLEKEKKESELKRLTAQVDPHFLFNNLNTVDSLIDTNPKIAKTYLNKLAHLYRYLITTKDQEVVELTEELEFVKNYIYLIESRFGDAFQFEIISKHNDNIINFIPPGALQTLLENIVKHNQPSLSKPIKGVILIKTDTIEISNNLNIKKEKVDSTGTGLENLNARYKLLTDKKVDIQINDYFKVILPLIKMVD